MPTDGRALVRLLQLSSPALPIGLYAYSQGLEQAVADGWIESEKAAARWIGGLLERVVARTDAPILLRLHRAWEGGDLETVACWSRHLYALRETAELRAEDRHGGQSLSKLLVDLGVSVAKPWTCHSNATLATAFSLAAVSWRVAAFEATLGYLWGWLENQVLCAVKLVPLGQTAGQRLLGRLGKALPALAQQAFELDDTAIGASAFAQALVSSRHEVQYSRLFRS